ncbi:MAG: glycosyltransferase family 39 protein, partial [Anaerolineae bacterium]|nr:glycosyltransferase family 39 protein [Anaerolineae bacterium]
ALGALITWPIDTSDMDQVRWLNPHADIGVTTADRNVNMVIHTEAERFPYRGTVLAIHVVRWLSVLMGAGTVVLAYLLAQTLAPDDMVLALGATAITAFNAMFLFITSSVNNDALVAMLCALALWLMARYVCIRPHWHQWVLLGAVLGLATLAKTSALGMLALAAIAGMAVARRQRSWNSLFIAGISIALPFALLTGWWFWRNWRLYGDPTGLKTFVSIVGARYPQPTLRQLAGEWQGFVMSFWGLFGGVNVPAPGWVYTLLTPIGVLGLLASPLYLYRLKSQERLEATKLVQFGLVALWPLIVLASLVRWSMMTIASQGRLMFSALTALSVLMAMGLSAILPHKLRAIGPAILSSTLLVVAVLTPFVIIAPAYARPPILDEQDLPPMTILNADFGGKMVLLGYHLQSDTAAPGAPVPVTLYWRALAPMEQDYSVFVHLVGENDLIVGQRDMYPGQGTFATSLMQPGDIIADTYVPRIAPTVMTPNLLEVRAGLYQLDTGKRLMLSDGSDDAVRFGEIALPEYRENGIPNPLALNLEDRVMLVGYSLQNSAAAPGEAFHLTLYWRVLRDLTQNYTVFTQVIGPDNSIWAQVDNWPQDGASPTSTWRKGQLVEDSYSLRVKNDAPPGVYQLQVGMYDSQVRRLNLLGPGGFAQDNRILLGNVRIGERPHDSR